MRLHLKAARIRRRFAAGLAAFAIAVTTAVAMAHTAGSAAAATTVPRYDHVVVVMFENTNFSDIDGSTAAPYFNSLASQGALFTQSFGVTHPSQPNYVALFSGSQQGVTDDTCPQNFTTGNLGQQLIAAGKTFGAYSEDLPSAGYTGCSSTNAQYQRKHAPWVDFPTVGDAAHHLPFTSFPTDYTTLPTVSFVVPNMCNDIHDCSIGTGDTWLKTNLDAYAQWAKTHNSLLITTFDEDNFTTVNQIYTSFVGQGVTPGRYAEQINHYSVLRTLEDMYGLPALGNAASKTAITDVFGTTTPANTVTVTNPGNQTGTAGTAASLQITATDSAAGQTLTYSATGLPAGLSINASTGLISGTPTTAGTASVTVKATDTTGASGSASFTWTVNPPAGSGGIVNGGFETGTFSGWTTTGTTSIVNTGAHSGTYAAMLGATTATNGDSTAAQTFTVPAGSANLSFWYNVTCPDTVSYDWATATLTDTTTNTTSTVLPKTCVANSGWTQVTAPVVAGHTYTLTLVNHDDNYGADPTRTLYDDVALTAAPTNPIVNGGFETGTFSGWTTTGTTSIVNSGAHSGTYAAMLGATTATNGDSTAAQTFTASNGGTLSFWYNVTCPDTVSYDWATATLKDNTTNTTSTVLPKTCVAGSGWTNVTSALVAGHSYTLTLVNHDDNYGADPTRTLFDDVTVG